MINKTDPQVPNLLHPLLPGAMRGDGENFEFSSTPRNIRIHPGQPARGSRPDCPPLTLAHIGTTSGRNAARTPSTSRSSSRKWSSPPGSRSSPLACGTQADLKQDDRLPLDPVPEINLVAQVHGRTPTLQELLNLHFRHGLIELGECLAFTCQW